MSYKIINNEECRPIEGFERYHISESGRVYRTTALNSKEEKLLEDGAPFIVEKMVFFRENRGKLRQGNCSLGDSNGKLNYLVVSELIAIAFDLVGEKFKNKKFSIKYKDGNKRNLHYSNLIVTQRVFGNTKLSKEQVKEIRKLIKEGIPLNKIGKEYGVSEMQINRIKTGENWGNGRRKIKAPEAPFPIQDGKIRKYIAIFDRKPAPENIKRPFTIKRNPKEPTDNTIIGIVNGFKLSIKHKNITRARVNVDKLNDYFFKENKEADLNIDNIINM